MRITLLAARIALLGAILLSNTCNIVAGAETPVVCHFVKPQVVPIDCHHVGFGNQPGSDAPFVRTSLHVLDSDGCSELDPLEVGGKLVVIRRGTCPFSTKATNAHRAHAVGVLFVNDRDDDLSARNIMADSTDFEAQSLAFPIVFVTRSVGRDLLKIARPDDVAVAPVTTFEVITKTGWVIFGSSFNAGQKLMQQGQSANAVNYFVEAVRINSWDYYTSLTLGQLLYQTQDMARAKFIFEHTTHIRPQESYSHIVLGSILSSEGMYEEARQRYETALSVSDNEAATFNIKLSIATLLPRIMPDAKSLRVHLRRVQSDLSALAESTKPIVGLQTPTTIPSYLFAYYASGTTVDGGLKLYETLGEVMRRTQPALSFVAPHVPSYSLRMAQMTEDSNSRIRIGFISSFFHTHTLMQLFLGVIENLPRSQFEVIALDISARPADAVTRRVKRAASQYVKLPQIDSVGLTRIQEQIAALELDALVFNDIGLSQHTWFLAFARLAPVQCLTLSNGMTSGLSTIDYYVSTIESQPGLLAQDKYSESLVLLDSLYFHLDDPLRLPDGDDASAKASAAAVIDYFERMQNFEFAQVTKAALRRQLGLPPNSNLYGCFQGLFKIHPDFDATVFEILRLDSNAVVLFMHDPKKPSWTQLLKARFKQTAEALTKEDPKLGALALTALSNGRIHFADKLPHTEYIKFMLSVDVHLDPFPFGGGLTTAELLGLHLPVVTLPGKHRSGRLTTAMYAKMGLRDTDLSLVAKDRSQYAKLAARLGTDEQFNRRVTDAIGRQRDVLFSPESHSNTVRQWSSFLKSAVHQARRGSIAPERTETSADIGAISTVEYETVHFAVDALKNLPPAVSIIDFSGTDLSCRIVAQLGESAKVVQLVGTNLDSEHSSCNGAVVRRYYDVERSSHPARMSAFDVALSLDSQTIISVFDTGGLSAVIMFLTHLFTSSQRLVLLQVPQSLRDAFNISIKDPLPDGAAGAAPHRRLEDVTILALVNRMFPNWELVSLAPNGESLTALAPAGLFCVFEARQHTINYAHSHLRTELSPTSVENSEELLDFAVTPLVVERRDGEWNAAVAARLCLDSTTSRARRALPWLSLNPATCTSQINNFLISMDEGKIDPERGDNEPIHGATRSSSEPSSEVLSADERSNAQCTLVVPVYKRLSTLVSFLKHYEPLEWLASIVVVWNNVEVEPFDRAYFNKNGVAIDVTVVQQSRNSLNNRYMVSSEHINTPCVLAVDDDDLFDLDELSMLKQVCAAASCVLCVAMTTHHSMYTL